jgi:hypothetical protein
MAKAGADKPAGSGGFFSSLGTLLLACLLLAFGFWAGRTFETLWPSSEAPAAPRPSVAVATVPPSTLRSPATSPSASASLAPSPSAPASSEPFPAASPSAAATVAQSVAPAAPAARSSRRGSARKPATGSAGSATASAPAPPLAAAPALAPRPFVSGTGVVESLKASQARVPGFETGGLGVKRAPEVPGRVDFEVSPPSVKAGDSYAVRVFLVNDGGKAIAIDALNVAMVADGRRSARAMPPRARSVAPKERALLAELPGVWQDGLASWALEVAVTSKRQDRYTNTLNWK